MTIHTMRLVMGILFLLLAGFMFGREWILPNLDAKFNTTRMNLGGMLALAFGCLNLVRWYTVWSYRRRMATPVRNTLQPDPSAEPREAPNPELDFTKPADGAK